MTLLRDLESDSVKQYKGLLREWAKDKLEHLSGRVADRTETDAGNQLGMPAVVRDLREASCKTEVRLSELDELEEDQSIVVHHKPAILKKLHEMVYDLSIVDLMARGVDNTFETESFGYEVGAHTAGAQGAIEGTLKRAHTKMLNNYTAHLVKVLLSSASEADASGESGDESDDDLDSLSAASDERGEESDEDSEEEEDNDSEEDDDDDEVRAEAREEAEELAAAAGAVGKKRKGPPESDSD